MSRLSQPELVPTYTLEPFEQPDFALSTEPREPWSGTDTAPLTHLPAQTEHVRYARFQAGVASSNKPIFVVNGFTGDINGWEPVAEDMAANGHTVIVPGQNRTAGQPGTPSRIRALNNLAVIENEGLQHTPLNLWPHSEGFLTVQEMLPEAFARGWTCFDGADMFVEAPAGVYPDESHLQLAKRNTASNAQEVWIEGMANGNIRSSLVRQAIVRSIMNFSQNVPRTVGEIVELGTVRTDWQRLMALTAGRVTVRVLADDQMFSHRQLDPGMQQAFDSLADDSDLPSDTPEDVRRKIVSERLGRLTYATPVPAAVGTRNGRQTREMASHNDHTYHPQTVGAVARYFFETSPYNDLQDE